MSNQRWIAAVEEIPEDGTLLFSMRSDGETVEGILLREDETVVAWHNYCQHWTDVALDRGDGATIRDGELLCGRHGATFEIDSGDCTHGPCEGATLDPIEIDVRDGDVFLAEEAYEFERLGAAEQRDLSTSRSLGFH